jgi:hypothetical protein
MNIQQKSDKNRKIKKRRGDISLELINCYFSGPFVQKKGPSVETD